MYKIIKFINDNNVEIALPEHPFSKSFESRINQEKNFRLINTFMMENSIIDKTKNIIDLGSWIGDNSIPWSKVISGIIYSIDPSPKNGEFINKVKELNSITNITFIEKAISNKPSIITTNHDLQHTMFITDGSGSIKVESTSLDELYRNGVIKDIGYIHLDVEGMENLVIEGSEIIISTYRPVISFEQHIKSDDYMGLSNSLKDSDYTVYLINEQFPGCKSDCRNLLAIPNEKLLIGFLELIQNYIKDSKILTKL